MFTAKEENDQAQAQARAARVKALAQQIYTAERPVLLGPEDQHLMATEAINAAEVFEFEWEAGSRK
jgi:hypothetical protein